jgi:hypothetical protein
MLLSLVHIANTKYEILPRFMTIVLQVQIIFFIEGFLLLIILIKIKSIKNMHKRGGKPKEKISTQSF